MLVLEKRRKTTDTDWQSQGREFDSPNLHQSPHKVYDRAGFCFYSESGIM
jgi:hypothetical protein